MSELGDEFREIGQDLIEEFGEEFELSWNPKDPTFKPSTGDINRGLPRTGLLKGLWEEAGQIKPSITKQSGVSTEGFDRRVVKPGDMILYVDGPSVEAYVEPKSGMKVRLPPITMYAPKWGVIAVSRTLAGGDVALYTLLLRKETGDG